MSVHWTHGPISTHCRKKVNRLNSHVATDRLLAKEAFAQLLNK